MIPVRKIANSATRIVTKDLPAILRIWVGEVKDEYLKVTNQYEEIETTVRMNPIPAWRLEQSEGYDRSKVYKLFYLNYRLTSSDVHKGMDEIVVNGKTYKIDTVEEDFSETSGWSKVRGILQA